MRVQFNSFNYNQIPITNKPTFHDINFGKGALQSAVKSPNCNSIKTRGKLLNKLIYFFKKVFGKKIAVYAGTFDPLTNGHKYLISAGAQLYDELIVLIGVNPNKNPRYSVETRKQLIEESVKDLPNVKVDFNEGLTVDYAKKHRAKYLLRGMRPKVQDFADEVKIHDANEKTAPGILTVYLLASSINKAVSSSAIRQLMDEGKYDEIKELVPEPVYRYIIENAQNRTSTNETIADKNI